MKLSGGTIEWPKATSRGAKRPAGEVYEEGFPPPQGWGFGGVVSPRENFEIWDTISCNLVHFGKKFRFLHLSTFVNENNPIVLDSGIDTVTYYFNFLPSDEL